ncbi:MAG: iron ABC transporter permease [Desulfobacterales bacterium]|nr:iron ABC transporter permease [Desulfobacterales bacterium]
MTQSLKNRGGVLTAAFIALITLSPVLFILASGIRAEPEIWGHLKQYVLPELLRNTVVLVTGVIATTSVLGVSLAWLTSFYEFRGRRMFERLLLFPLAIPAYVMAFIYTGLLDFAGPVRTAARAHFPSFAGMIPEIRSAWGVIMVISLAVFPYVFLMASSGFRSMGRSVVEASLSLGQGRISTLFRVTIPMARPWIFGGLILVFMETLADFGAVSVFNYDTFTTGVYKAWYGFFSINAASQLASILVLIVLAIFLAEAYMKRKQKFFNRGSHQPAERQPLKGAAGFFASGYCSLVFGLAFGVPVAQLIVWTFEAFHVEISAHYGRLLLNTFTLGFLGMITTMAVAVGLAYACRAARDWKAGLFAKLSLTGYALPGTVLAVGIIGVMGWADAGLVSLAQAFGLEVSAGLIKGSLLLLPLCYMIRFLTAGYNPVHGNMTRMTASMDEAASLMQVTGMKLLSAVHLPLIRRGIITGSILVLVEIIKEMPVTLMLRPFGWDTLAVKIFELTSEGEWERAALPAVTLVLAGMIPIIILTLMGKQRS